jgi:biotin carboxylase
MASRKQIILICTKGGPPLDYTVERIAAYGDVHLLLARQPPPNTPDTWRELCASVVTAPDPARGEELVEFIVETAGKVHADAIVPVAEFAMLAVAEAARRLGLRSSGPHTLLSRDKRRMRAAWVEAGLNCPRFRPVSSAQDLRTAFAELEAPMLLKSAWGAGSIAQRIISSPDDIETVWADATSTVAGARDVGATDLLHQDAGNEFLVEEIIRGSTSGWWPDNSGYGDYLSVEGVVADGVYHPLCIASRMPTIDPFTELSNLIPCAMPEDLQRRIEAAATQAVNALKLETCATHTEMKLMADGSLWLIESAARVGGCMIPAQMEHVFGLEPVGMVTGALLGNAVDFPERMMTFEGARGAAGSLALIATDSAGTPWSDEHTWEPSVVDWDVLISPGTRIDLVPGQSIAPGMPIPRYDVSAGCLSYGGIFYLRSLAIGTLLKDMYAVLDGLEAPLKTAAPDE